MKEKISKVSEFARMVSGSRGTPDEKTQLMKKLDEAVNEEVEIAARPLIAELQNLKNILNDREKLIIELKAKLAEIRSAFAGGSDEG